MEDVGKEGRTILFVSHNMPAITRLCSKAFHLREGRIVKSGDSYQVVSDYVFSGTSTMAERVWSNPIIRPGNDIVRLCAVRVKNGQRRISETIDIRHPVGIEMEFDVLKPGHVLVPNYHFLNQEGAYLFVAIDQDPEWRRKTRPTGHFVSTAWVPGNFFTEDILTVGVAISTFDPLFVHFYERDAVSFHIIDTIDGDSARGDYGGPLPGVIRPILNWSTLFDPRDVSVQYG
jgi:lipopolysaccharide transport system ATP-binding protein